MEHVTPWEGVEIHTHMEHYVMGFVLRGTHGTCYVMGRVLRYKHGTCYVMGTVL